MTEYVDSIATVHGPNLSESGRIGWVRDILREPRWDSIDQFGSALQGKRTAGLEFREKMFIDPRKCLKDLRQASEGARSSDGIEPVVCPSGSPAQNSSDGLA
jgi:hypothetical protein